MFIIPKKCFAVLALIIILPFGQTILNAQTELQRIAIEPLNRASFYFSQIPDDYSSALAIDKKKITFKINKAAVSDSAREAHGAGVIDDIYVFTSQGNLEINIILKEKRGFTSSPLPYSKALMLEVFQWDKLDPAEDSYRLGLLAMQDGIREAALKHFTKSAKLGNPDAAAFLGILNLEDGNFKAAFDNLLFAYKSKTSIPDAYACLAQLLRMRNFPDKADYCIKIFTEKTGIASISELAMQNLYETSDSSFIILDSLITNFDFTEGKEVTIATTQDTIGNKQFEKLFKENKDSTKSITQQIFQSLFPENFSSIFIYIIIFTLLIAAILLFAYFRWRKQQLGKQQKSKEAKEQLPPKTAKAAQSAHAARAYKKTGSMIDKTTESGMPAEKKEDESIRKEPLKAEPQPISFEEKLDRIASGIEAANKTEYASEDKELTEEDFDRIKEIKPSVSAKVELALHLQEEQQKLKKKNIEELKTSEIPSDIKKLAEIAKQLGIEKSAVETRKEIDKLEKDKKQLSHFAEKFTEKKDEPDAQ